MKYSLKNHFVSFLIIASVWAATYFAVFEGSKGAENLLTFYFILQAVVSVMAILLCAKTAENIIKKEIAFYPLWFLVLRHTAMACIFAWVGWFWLASVVIIQFFSDGLLRIAVNTAREKNALIESVKVNAAKYAVNK